MQRRKFLRDATAAGAGLATLTAAAKPVFAQAGTGESQATAKGGIPLAQQSACYWCFNGLPLEETLPKLKSVGLSAIDLIVPSKWDVVRDQGFKVSMCYAAEDNDITTGFIDPDLHDGLVESYTASIKRMPEYGWTDVICFAGNRRGRNDLHGLRNAAKGLKRLMPVAADNGVTVQLEVFNSKVDHPDYMGDSTPWAVALCDMVDSDNFKILWDIYHMQVQEGDIIRSIRDFHPYFGHYHTAGVPGRHELGDDQELRYPAVARAIMETGYTGYVAHEFIPTQEDWVASLRQAIEICA